MATNRKVRSAGGGTSRAGDPSKTRDVFPPLSISLEAFVKDGSDRDFRRLIYSLVGLAALMGRNRERFASYIGVTDPQYVMMTLVAENPASTVGQLADRMRVSSQFVTIETGKLIKTAILEKRTNEADRRSSLLRLTARGESLLRELGPIRRRTNDLMFRSLDAERARLLQDIVDALLSDGKGALHELAAPHIRDLKAPSAQAEAETD